MNLLWGRGNWSLQYAQFFHCLFGVLVFYQLLFVEGSGIASSLHPKLSGLLAQMATNISIFYAFMFINIISSIPISTSPNENLLALGIGLLLFMQIVTARSRWDNPHDMLTPADRAKWHADRAKWHADTCWQGKMLTGKIAMRSYRHSQVVT